MTNQEEYEDYFRLTEPCESVVFDFDKAGGEYADNNKCIIQRQADAGDDDTNLLLSRHADGSGVHRVVLDLDMDAVLVPSSTPGHHHLILEHDLLWKDYLRLLAALAAAGIIEEGYYKAAKQNGYTAVRTPWTKKVTKAVGGVIESFNKAKTALSGISSAFQTIKFSNVGTLTTGQSVKLTAPITSGSTITIQGVGTFDTNGNPIKLDKTAHEERVEAVQTALDTPIDPFAETTDEQSEKLQAMIKKVV